LEINGNRLPRLHIDAPLTFDGFAVLHPACFDGVGVFAVLQTSREEHAVHAALLSGGAVEPDLSVRTGHEHANHGALLLIWIEVERLANVWRHAGHNVRGIRVAWPVGVTRRVVVAVTGGIIAGIISGAVIAATTARRVIAAIVTGATTIITGASD